MTEPAEPTLRTPAPRSYAHAARLPAEPAFSLAAALAGEGPVLLEIGSGRGAFSVAYAAANPAHRLLALEIRLKHAALLDERLRSSFGGRARCFAEDARAALPRLSDAGCLAAAAIHFPDPWWKKRHHKRLVVADTLLAQLARLLAPGGLLLVQTDVEDRANEYRERLDAEPLLRNAAGTPTGLADDSPFAPARSNREVRAMADGLPIYRLLYARRERAMPDAK